MECNGCRELIQLDIPVTVAEKKQIQDAAEVDGMKPVTWARDVLLKFAKRKLR